MCELLVIRQTENKSYVKGDVVVIMPDNHQWGREEQLPHFYVIKLPGVPIKDMEYLTNVNDKDLTVKRLDSLDIDKFSLQEKEQLELEGKATLSKTKVESSKKTRKPI